MIYLARQRRLNQSPPFVFALLEAKLVLLIFTFSLGYVMVSLMMYIYEYFNSIIKIILKNIHYIKTTL